jgi:hypothetical protein
MKQKTVENGHPVPMCNNGFAAGLGRSLASAARFMLLWLIMVGMASAQTQPSAPDASYMDINVMELAGLDIRRSLTGGIPIAEGAAPKGARFLLYDKDNRAVPCQTEVLATWKDGSARWVLLDFQSKPEANSTDRFRLKWDAKAKEVQPSAAVRALQGKTVSISSGNVQLKTIHGSVLRISNRFDVKFVLMDRSGKRCEAIVESSKIETSGKMRSTMALSGSFRTPEGKRLVDFRLRASVYAGLEQFYREPQILINADTSHGNNCVFS